MISTKTCAHCGKAIEQGCGRNRIYCDVRCQAAAKAERQRKLHQIGWGGAKNLVQHVRDERPLLSCPRCRSYGGRHEGWCQP